MSLAACGKSASSEEASLEGARSAFISGEYLLSETLYQRYLESHPKGRFRAEAWQRLADISQFARNAPAKAATLLETSLLEFETDAVLSTQLRLRIAALYQSLHASDKADRQYRFLLAGKDLSPELRCAVSQQFSQALLQARHFQQAVSVLRTSLATLPQGRAKAQCTLYLALLLLRLEQPDEAESLLAALQDDPEAADGIKAQARFALASLYEARKNITGARALYDSIRQSYPNHLVIEQKLQHLQ